MAVHSIKAVQKIPVPLSEAWNFFSNPANLDKITPDDLGFIIISKNTGEKIYPGQKIEYKVSPILRIPLYWMTEINDVEENKFFVDEQRKGPYSLWHHEHHFKEIQGGVEMTDIVSYRIPLGLIGEAANSIFVKKKLQDIFKFRFRKVEEVFGKWPQQIPSIQIN